MVQPLRIGLELAGLRQPFKQALHTAAQLGVEAVQFDGRKGVFVVELSQSGLRPLRKIPKVPNLWVSAASFPTRRGDDVSDDPDRRVAATKWAMRLASQFGAGVVVNQVGMVPTAVGDPDAAVDPRGFGWPPC